ncbi:hypothetical protein LVY72_17085 [Arthrobacter sp. I2-34]|uniref:CHRD domain-containing protein n=1 Tax=Arthrobacter hankyongi TaxID=2904801 RepID=A0ABS9LAA1_9MICC|nr:hypothetical protein [Arthrobacter hankyongi]MCG2623614.1 hypothetical protein [Arthrobacter hankyongi]
MATVVLALSAFLAGCSAPAESGHPGQDPIARTDAPGTGTPASRLTAGAGLYSACTTPEAAKDGTGLTSVALVTQDGQLVLAFTFVKPVAGNLRLESAFGAGHDPADTPAAGKFTVQVSLADGLPSEAVVRTPSGASVAARTADVVHVAGNLVHVDLPGGILTPLGGEWHWRAAVSSATGAVACPGAGDGSGVVTVG